jgi:hypothetical protein
MPTDTHVQTPPLTQQSKIIKQFDKLPISTLTCMVYTNVTFDIPKIFKSIPIQIVEIPLTKKHRKVDKRGIRATYGSIFSAQYKNDVRGIRIRKQRKETKYFLNQMTVDLSLGGEPSLNLNIMIFKDSLKIVGCRSIDNAIEATMILWDYIKADSTQFSFNYPTDTYGKFVFETVMKNYDFSLGFRIDREALNIVMNSNQFSDKVYMSQFESTGNTNVKIKLHTKKPEDYKYECLHIPVNSEAYFEYLSVNPYENPKKKKKEIYITLLVFASSQTILSGRYDDEMKRVYKFFVDAMDKCRDKIEEQLVKRTDRFIDTE